MFHVASVYKAYNATNKAFQITTQTTAQSLLQPQEPLKERRRRGRHNACPDRLVYAIASPHRAPVPRRPPWSSLSVGAACKYVLEESTTMREGVRPKTPDTMSKSTQWHGEHLAEDMGVNVALRNHPMLLLFCPLQTTWRSVADAAWQGKSHGVHGSDLVTLQISCWDAELLYPSR